MHRLRVDGEAKQLAGEPLILEPAGHNVVSHDDANCGGHCGLLGENSGQWKK
jgi:hypothetical protein